MTDTSKQFIAMADCPQIQDYYFNNRDFYELLPSFLYRKDMERTVIEIWTPSKLRKQLNMKLDILNINIEYKSELGEITKREIIDPFDFRIDDGPWICYKHVFCGKIRGT